MMVPQSKREMGSISAQWFVALLYMSYSPVDDKSGRSHQSDYSLLFSWKEANNGDKRRAQNAPLRVLPFRKQVPL